MNALPSNVVAYSISSLLYCCYCECKGLVLGPGMNVVPSTLGGYRITWCKGFVLGPGRYFPSNVGGYSITSSL